MQRSTAWLAGGGAGALLATGAAWAALLPEWAAVVAVAAGVGGWAWQRREERRPLELSPVAVRRGLAACPAVQVRARLGRGRTARRVVATVVHRQGERVAPLRVVDLGVPAVTGPFTITALGEVQGTLEVEVEVREGDRTWVARRAYAPGDVVEGRFADLGDRGWSGTRPEPPRG